RVTAGGLAVDEERDGLAIAGDLDAAEGDTVRDDIVPAPVGDARSAQARAHAVGLGQHLVVATEQRREAVVREALRLRAEDDADLRRGGAIDRYRPVGAGHRDRARRLDREAWAEHRALEAGGRVGVADETIREHERRAVDRSRLRNAIAELAGAPQILHGGLGAGVEN